MTAHEPISPHPWLDELARRIESSVDVGDAKSVHQLRVAAGRLSVWIELGGRAVLRDDLRRLRRLVTHVRDADVLMARRADSATSGSLHETRTEALTRALLVLRTSAPRGLLVGLACVPWPEFTAAERRARKFAGRVVEAASIVERGDRDAEAVHRWRRRVRRARYALEWLGRDSTRARDLQDLLGAWHDAAIEEAAGRTVELRADGLRDESCSEARINAALREREACLESALTQFAEQQEYWLAWASAKDGAWTST